MYSTIFFFHILNEIVHVTSLDLFSQHDGRVVSPTEQDELSINRFERKEKQSYFF